MLHQLSKHDVAMTSFVGQLFALRVACLDTLQDGMHIHDHRSGRLNDQCILLRKGILEIVPSDVKYCCFMCMLLHTDVC